MIFTEKEISLLRDRVRKSLGEKRFIHTLGVEEMAVKIGRLCLPKRIDELRVAALLHDISKEYSEAEHLEIAKRHNIRLSDEDIMSPPLWHSITAPLVLEEEYSEYATDDIKSAVRNHSTGSPDMSVFDEIILLSDYIEEGRKHRNCTEVRKEFFDNASQDFSPERNILALHVATLSSLDRNIKVFISKGVIYHSQTRLTRDAIFLKIERQKNGSN